MQVASVFWYGHETVGAHSIGFIEHDMDILKLFLDLVVGRTFVDGMNDAASPLALSRKAQYHMVKPSKAQPWFCSLLGRRTF